MRALLCVLFFSVSALFAQGTPFIVQGDLTADLSDSLLDGIYRHRLGFDHCPCERSVWVQGFGTYRSRGGSTHRDRYSDGLGGVLVGFNYALSCASEFNFFIGGSWGSIKIPSEPPHYDTDSFLFGMTLENTCGNQFWGLAIAGGFLQAKRHDRPFGLREDAQGVFLTPELTWAYQLCCFRCQPITSVTLRYAGFFVNDYEKQEPLGTFFVQDRAIQLITLRGEFAAPLTCFCTWNLQPYLAAAGRFQADGRNVSGQLLAQNFSISCDIDRSIGEILLGFRAAKKTGRFDLQANLEGGFDSDNSSRIIGELSINFAY